MNDLKKNIKERYEIPEDSLNKLLGIISLNRVEKNHIIAKEGKIPENVYIIKSGIVRSFYTDEKGKEYIRNLFEEKDGTGALGDLVLQKPSILTYQCLTECEIYSFNYKCFKEITQEDIYISNFYNNCLEKIFLRLENKIYDLSVINATERYLRLKKQIPEIENLIAQYHIASYLNITPVQLSRIRKKIYSK